MENTTEKPKQGRGQLTLRVLEKSKELLGYEISIRELRLMPYLQYTMMNNHHINDSQLNDEEIDILNKWKNQFGFINYGESSKLWMSKEFWDNINQILYLAYVDLND